MNQESNTKLALVGHGPTAQWELIQRQCKAFLESNYLPSHIKTPAQAITIAWKGHELGIPPLVAFSEIVMISGKPSLSANLMRSLVFRKYPNARIELITPPERQREEASYLAQREGGKEQIFKFTIKDAETAGLLKKENWVRYPMAMLQQRASAMACRMVFPDALMGVLYTPEELGANEIIDVEAVEGAYAPSQQSIPSAASQPPPPPRQVGNTVGYEKRHEERMNEPATEKQIARLYAIGKNLQMGHEQLKTLANEIYGVEHLQELTKGQVQGLFEELDGARSE